MLPSYEMLEKYPNLSKWAESNITRAQQQLSYGLDQLGLPTSRPNKLIMINYRVDSFRIGKIPSPRLSRHALNNSESVKYQTTNYYGAHATKTGL
jgi:hypothetical protein